MAAHYPNFAAKMPCLTSVNRTQMSATTDSARILPGLLADGVLIAHLAFIVFVVLGGVLVLRWHRLAFLHVPAVLWGIFIELSGRICPLTPLENSLREAAGQAGYSGGFIEHYITAAIYPDGLSRGIQMLLAALVVAVNATVYWRLCKKVNGE